ncbi:MAG: phosphate/phosphite/phosphonate ABC transporter substrate-binding protein [Gammaproteobacteria bacterium]|nr:phosphate/phosphite/phosphonate ABC transporter substrate-binding protein [Gammaproteobacteria bacterium]
MLQKIFLCLTCFTLFFPFTAGASSPLTEDDLIMGVFPRRNAETTIRYFKPMANYLSQKLNRTVRIETSRDFQSFWQDIKQKRYDLVHFNQYHYVQSNKEFGYQVILKNSEFGKQTIAGTIVVRKDSNINSLPDLKGKKIMFGGGKKAMIAYIIPTYLLQQAGLTENDYKTVFAKNPPNAILGTYLKQADAGGTGDVLLNHPVITRRIKTDQLKIIAQGKQLPHLPWATKDTMSSLLKNTIQKLLSELQLTKEGTSILKSAHLSKMVIATDTEYNIIRTIIKKVTGEQL